MSELMKSSLSRAPATALCCVLWLSIFTGTASAQEDWRSLWLTGVNLPSAAFGPEPEPGKPRGKAGRDYAYPTPHYSPGYQGVDYFLQKGMNTFRLAFLWERLQPKLGSDLDPKELGMLRDSVSYLLGKGAWVILDVHNYARYDKQLIGGPQVTVETFADLWSKLGSEFGKEPKIIFGLMNEPHGIAANVWANASNAAIAAIRKTGAQNLILVPGITFSSTLHWADSGNEKAMQSITDPLNHIAFEGHVYLNASANGLNEDCVDANVGVERMQPFVSWLKAQKQKGFLGEFGAGRSETCQAALAKMGELMSKNRDLFLGWNFWAAGPRWPPDYFTSVEPKRGADAPQLQALVPYVK